VNDAQDACPGTPAGTAVGADGCEVQDGGTTPVDNGTDNQSTDGENNTTLPGDDGTADDDTVDDSDKTSGPADVQSDSELFGMSPMVVYGIAGLVIVSLLSMLLLRGRSKGPTSAFAAQEKAYDAATLATSDPTITAEQLAYEQQLLASGYPADYARAYADQHFRPWLKN
jgi:hypothetical protein